jgi:ADP-heptose:LPS heptosyltransferase
VSNPKSFYREAKNARKLLVLDLGFLGDTIHLLPALWAIRQAWPVAELHVMVAEHVTSLLDVAPWINQVWGYPRFPKGPKPWQDWDRIRRMRSARFDAILNLNGSDRSSTLTWLSGAPLRLGRCRTMTLKNRIFFTHSIVSPGAKTLISEQHLELLQTAGLKSTPLEYHISIPETIRQSLAQSLNIPSGSRRALVHVNPFTTQDFKELPIKILASALNQIHRFASDLPMVISCANNERERVKLHKLTNLLDFSPYRVFAGNLSLVELVAVLSMSRLHLGGDSGGLHVAVMTCTPSVSWFRRYDGACEWMPKGLNHSTLIGEQSENGILGINATTLVEEAKKLLQEEPSESFDSQSGLESGAPQTP